MEKRVSDFDDKSYFDFKRPKREEVKAKSSIGNCKRVKAKRVKKADKLDDVKLVGSMCIMILKFLVLLNILVITGRML